MIALQILVLKCLMKKMVELMRNVPYNQIWACIPTDACKMKPYNDSSRSSLTFLEILSTENEDTFM